MKHKLLRITALGFVIMVSLSSVLLAQDGQQKPKPKVVSFGSDSVERGTTRVGYWNVEKNMGIGQFAIDYGRPIWRKEYEDTAKFDAMTKGKVYRLGSNFWTTLDTDMALKIAGKPVPAGSWYLGLHRSEDGATWSLAFIEPAKARALHVDASELERAPVAFKIPMTTEQAGEMKEKLTIDLVRQKENLRAVTLTIAWGKIQLSAPVEVPVPEIK
ncbi:MAG TPA: DUF2911 domain-containing protein [Blastocatellia bacterium]|nr:DUF2911 domain-containing protein [Blastocatellia bacterium]